MATEFQSTHNLPFLSKRWDKPFNDENWQQFKIGTCVGQWNSTPECYNILTVINEEPGNGHFQDVLDWFENSCRRDKKDLMILELINEQFAFHLVTKQGFTYKDNDNLIKRFR